MKLSVIAVRNGQRVFWPLGACLTVLCMTAAVASGAWLGSFVIPSTAFTIVLSPMMVGAGLTGHIRWARRAPLENLPQLDSSPSRKY